MVRVDGLTAQAWEMDGRSGDGVPGAGGRLGGGALVRVGREGGGVMASARVSIGVDETAPLRSHRFVSGAGEPVAWLHVGEERELHVYGVAGGDAALRRDGDRGC